MDINPLLYQRFRRFHGTPQSVLSPPPAPEMSHKTSAGTVIDCHQSTLDKQYIQCTKFYIYVAVYIVAKVIRLSGLADRSCSDERRKNMKHCSYQILSTVWYYKSLIHYQMVRKQFSPSDYEVYAPTTLMVHILIPRFQNAQPTYLYN